MTTTTMTRLARDFFTLRPRRDLTISTQRALQGAAYVLITQVADFSTTVYGVFHGAVEANGAMAHLIAHYGVPGFAAIKMTGAILLAWTSWRRRLAPWVIGTIYTAVVLSNLLVISWL